ncbi:MAG: acyl-CoA ligase (AMP-forming), exosortase A system-associated [Gammaproteobacteria bacterium]|nr:MAG: acyl-CoA ligase (AMP-forming), exosortase A system-associated [Gammaproteobacteria bacterium]
MVVTITDFVKRYAAETPDATALLYRKAACDYQQLWRMANHYCHCVRAHGVKSGDRVAVYLPKQIETVALMLAVWQAGAILVPINPALKPRQISHIVRDCQPRLIVTNDAWAARFQQDSAVPVVVTTVTALAAMPTNGVDIGGDVLESDPAVILYTSGSTGRAKGVVASHRNLVLGAESVASYLQNHAQDTLLALLPFSFDYGLSQLTTAFSVGAKVVLHNYLLPTDVPRICAEHGVTGIAAVPPLWRQLVNVDWPDEARSALRYWTNSGGAMSKALLDKLLSLFQKAEPYLMYGLTEAFRSTYLPPDQVKQRPTSIGKAIPNARVHVVDDQGRECAPGVEGELVHRGPLVTLGYWNAPEETAQRFKPWPGTTGVSEKAVFSGDRVYRDEDGYLYFVARADEMIKCSGYRISPTEIEEVALECDGVLNAVAIGQPHPEFGQGVLLIVESPEDPAAMKDKLLGHCRRHLPSYMGPHGLLVMATLPRNANGKLDRAGLRAQYHDFFSRT